MDAVSVLEKSYIAINNNFTFYKKHFGHTYYLNVKEDETQFIDKLFKNTDNVLSAQDKMLNYSVSAIYTATVVLTELLDRNNINYSDAQLEEICKGFSYMERETISLNDKTEEELMEVLFGLLTDGIGLKSRKKSGSERTPEEIINYMLNLIGYEGEHITNERIIDPACGTGTYVAKIIERFIYALGGNATAHVIKKKLLNEKLILAYDTKPSNVYVTKIVLLSVLIRNGLVTNVKDLLELLINLPITCEDFLCSTEKGDYVVGNPPYIRLQNLPDKYREYIRSKFACATGRFDIYTCFIERADKLLNDGGKLCLITSDKYLTANYGYGIRNYLSQAGHVRKIVDLFDTRFFDAAVLPAIIMCENTRNNDCKIDYVGIKSTSKKALHYCNNAKELFEYIDRGMPRNEMIIGNGKDTFEVSRSKVSIPPLGNSWNFSSVFENDIKGKMDKSKYCTLGDIFDICVGIKTTADKVFVKPMTEKFVMEHAFESEVVYPLIQSFNVDKWNISWGENPKDRYILYPHREKHGTMAAVPLNEIPKAKKHLLKYADILKERTYLTESKTREWYECWVPQKLSKFQKLKIVTRDIVSHNSFALDETGMLCQGNTFFLTGKKSAYMKEYSSMTERQYYYFILGMLNSRVLEYYQKMISGCLYSQKYRYTTTNLNRWPIPAIKLRTAITISELVKQILSGEGDRTYIEKQIDCIMYEQFAFAQDEICKIEDFIDSNG